MARKIFKAVLTVIGLLLAYVAASLVGILIVR